VSLAGRWRWQSLWLLSHELSLEGAHVQSRQIAFKQISKLLQSCPKMLEIHSPLEWHFMVEVLNSVRAGDAGYLKRLLKALELAKENKVKKQSACELAMHLYLELVTGGKRPVSRQGFCLLLQERLKNAGVKVQSLRSIL